MKAAFLVLLPLGGVAIIYALTLRELHRPLPADFVQPEWAVDRYGRPYPVRWNPPAPQTLEEARMADQADLDEDGVETTPQKLARIKARDEAARLAKPPFAELSNSQFIGENTPKN